MISLVLALGAVATAFWFPLAAWLPIGFVLGAAGLIALSVRDRQYEGMQLSSAAPRIRERVLSFRNGCDAIDYQDEQQILAETRALDPFTFGTRCRVRHLASAKFVAAALHHGR